MTQHPNPFHPCLVRSPVEVQNAHDVLQLGLKAADRGAVRLDAVTYAALAGALNLSCWLLGHPNATTADVLGEIRADLAAAGLRVVELAEPGGAS